MSVKPSLIAWDSTLANTIAVTGIHQTNGWALSEAPTSGEVNTLGNNAYLWQSFLNDVFTIAGVANGSINLVTGNIILGAGFYKRGARVGKVAASGAQLWGGSATTSTGAVQCTGITRGVYYSIPLEEGQKLTSVSAVVQPGTAGTITVQANEQDPLGAGSVLATGTSSGIASQVITASVSPAALTSADHKNYFITVTQTAGTAGVIFSLEWTTTVP